MMQMHKHLMKIAPQQTIFPSITVLYTILIDKKKKKKIKKKKKNQRINAMVF